MENLPSWSLIGLGDCNCGNSNSWLFTHSCAIPHYGYEGDRTTNRVVQCLRCHRYRFATILDEETTKWLPFELEAIAYLRDTKPDTSPESTPYDLIRETPRCAVCNEPSNNLREARSVDNRTIIVQVHRSCSITTGCCNTLLPYSRTPWRTSSYSSITLANVTRIEGTETCDQCLEEREIDVNDGNWFYCENCNSYEPYDNRQRWGGSFYCEDCISNCVYTCDDCNQEYWDGDDHECDYDTGSRGVIMEYSDKPTPIFFGRTKTERVYFGIELEVEVVDGDRYEQAERVQNELGERVYIKADGSLNCGFEIVTHPHSLKAFHTEFEWEKLRTFPNRGLRSWDTRTCGLHVHVSRSAFGEPYDNRTDKSDDGLDRFFSRRRAHEIRFMKLIYDNQRQVIKLAGRHSPNYANFADVGNVVNKMYGRNDNGGRPSAVNTYNSDTLEVRVFKGSLKPERVLSAIELVHAAVEYTRDLKVSGKNKSLSWLAFAGYVHKNIETYPNLFEYMDKCMRQENAPIEDEESSWND